MSQVSHFNSEEVRGCQTIKLIPKGAYWLLVVDVQGAHYADVKVPGVASVAGGRC